MSLIDRVSERSTKMLTRSNDPVTLEEFGALLARGNGGGKTRSGVMMGPQRALGIPAWARGVNHRTHSVCCAPVHTYRERLGGEREERANPQWVKAPDADLTFAQLVEGWMMALLHRGNAYSFKVRNEVGQVVGLRPLLPHRVKPGRTLDGRKVFQVDGRNDIAYTAREILHIPGLSYDGVIGLDPISVHVETLGRIAAADEFASREFGDGFHMTAYLQVPGALTPQQATDLATNAKALHSGLQNAHELGVIGNGAELKTLSLNPEQLQLLESRKYGTIEVAQILGVPPHKLYNLDRATFSNIEQQSIEAVADGVKPWAERIEDCVANDPDLNVAGNCQEFDLENLMRGDLAGQMDAYSKGVSGGILMASEPRKRLRLPYVEGSDVLLQPLNMTPVGPDATPADAAPPEGAQP